MKIHENTTEYINDPDFDSFFGSKFLAGFVPVASWAVQTKDTKATSEMEKTDLASSSTITT